MNTTLTETNTNLHMEQNELLFFIEIIAIYTLERVSDLWVPGIMQKIKHV